MKHGPQPVQCDSHPRTPTLFDLGPRRAEQSFDVAPRESALTGSAKTARSVAWFFRPDIDDISFRYREQDPILGESNI